MPFKKGSSAWNKGLTKESDKRVAKYAKTKIKIETKKCVFCKKNYTNQESRVYGKNLKKRKFCSYKCWTDSKIENKKKYWIKSHEELIEEEKQKLIKKGFRVIYVDKVRPDLIAISGENIKIIAVEIERGTQEPNLKKYKRNEYYDKVKWVFKKPKGVGQIKKKEKKFFDIAMETAKVKYHGKLDLR